MLTRKEALEITCSFIQHFENQENIAHMLSDVLNLEILDMDSTYDSCTPALSEFQSTVCKLYCDTFLNDNSNYDSDDLVKRSVEIAQCGTAKQGDCDTLLKDSESDYCVRLSIETYKYTNHGRCESLLKDSGSDVGARPSMETSLCETHNSVEQADSDGHEAGEHSIHCDMSDVDQSPTRNQKVENALLDTLLSKSYEVRNTILEKLSEVMLCSIEQLKYASEDVGVDDSSECVGDSKMVSRKASVLQLSRRLYAQLLAMLDGESHEECQIKLLG